MTDAGTAPASVPVSDGAESARIAPLDDEYTPQIGPPHKVSQTILYDRELNQQGVFGNCVQAAVASLVGMPLDAVPHFVTFAQWDVALELWLRGIGLTRRVERVTDFPTDPCIVGGVSPRDVRHTVVVLGPGQVPWDPHPSRDGLATVEEAWFFDPFHQGPCAACGSWDGVQRPDTIHRAEGAA